jgi:pimeloyl-ACP methyl ester carboxylesterase
MATVRRVGFGAVELNHHRGGGGEPLVLIHGIGSRWQVWEPVLGALEAEREVVALDLPGFGASPMPPAGTVPGLASLTGLVLSFLEEIGIERPHVAGNSLGGWIALELARQGRARSATALSPAGFHNELEARFQRGSLWAAVRAARLIAGSPGAQRRLLGAPRARRLALGQLAAHPERMSFDDAVASIAALAGAPWFDATLPAIVEGHFHGGEQIKVPVTIAWGEKDRLLLPRQARRAAQAIPSAALVTLWDCGHVPTYDDPPQVARVLLDGSRSR